MAKKKAAPKKATPEEALNRYHEVFEEIGRFISVIDDTEEELKEAEAAMAEAKAAYDKAKQVVADIRELREGAKHGLFRYLSPADGGEILPLFDRMEPADEVVHGANSSEWRLEPLTALKLSLPSLTALNDAELMLVGQLQDKVLANPMAWWESITGLTQGAAAAITDRLNDFIFERTQK